MKHLTYLKFEVLRTLRNRRFLIFSLIFPLVLFFAIAGPNKHITVEGIHFPLYYMTAMASWGSMTAMLSSGARIAAERQIGWTRQMKITPLSTRTYFSAKVLCGYMMAIFSILCLGIAGSALGVHLSAIEWLKMMANLARTPHESRLPGTRLGWCHFPICPLGRVIRSNLYLWHHAQCRQGHPFLLARPSVPVRTQSEWMAARASLDRDCHMDHRDDSGCHACLPARHAAR